MTSQKAVGFQPLRLRYPVIYAVGVPGGHGAMERQEPVIAPS